MVPENLQLRHGDGADVLAEDQTDAARDRHAYISRGRCGRQELGSCGVTSRRRNCESGRNRLNLVAGDTRDATDLQDIGSIRQISGRRERDEAIGAANAPAARSFYLISGPTGVPDAKKEIPWFSEFQARYGEKGFAVVGVSLDENGWKVLRPFLDEHKVPYQMLLGDVPQQSGTELEICQTHFSSTGSQDSGGI